MTGKQAEKEVYLIELFKGCGSGRLIKLTEPIDIDPKKIISETITTDIRSNIREELEIE